jgi:hypothetical protein
MCVILIQHVRRAIEGPRQIHCDCPANNIVELSTAFVLLDNSFGSVKGYVCANRMSAKCAVLPSPRHSDTVN